MVFPFLFLTFNIIKKGSNLTIICYGLAVEWFNDATSKLSTDIQSMVEIVDLRTLIPWDKELVLSSIQKTGKVLIVHEASQTSGFGAEISAIISEKYFVVTPFHI